MIDVFIHVFIKNDHSLSKKKNTSKRERFVQIFDNDIREKN